MKLKLIQKDVHGSLNGHDPSGQSFDEIRIKRAWLRPGTQFVVHQFRLSMADKLAILRGVAAVIFEKGHEVLENDLLYENYHDQKQIFQNKKPLSELELLEMIKNLMEGAHAVSKNYIDPAMSLDLFCQVTLAGMNEYAPEVNFSNYDSAYAFMSQKLAELKPSSHKRESKGKSKSKGKGSAAGELEGKEEEEEDLEADAALKEITIEVVKNTLSNHPPGSTEHEKLEELRRKAIELKITRTQVLEILSDLLKLEEGLADKEAQDLNAKVKDTRLAELASLLTKGKKKEANFGELKALIQGQLRVTEDTNVDTTTGATGSSTPPSTLAASTNQTAATTNVATNCPATSSGDLLLGYPKKMS